MDYKLQIKLNKRQKEGTMRSLSSFVDFVDFYSNDYLGFSKLDIDPIDHPKNGSTGSRLISGNSVQAIHTESFLAQWFEVENALVFNSGYDANLGFFSAVPQKEDLVLYDEYIHASIRDGLRLSFAKCQSFKHNDLAEMERKMALFSGTKYLVVESLYSMDGDIAPLQEITSLCEKYNAYLVVDEAHSCGVFGPDGKGLVAQLGLSHKVFARIITFGKAYGTHGACVLGESDLINYLLNFSRSFIYTTALPPSAYSTIENLVQHPLISSRQQELRDKIAFFRSKTEGITFASSPTSPIQLLEIGDITHTKELAILLQNNKLAVKPIFSPTVSPGKEGIRICLHAFNTHDQIDLLIDSCRDFLVI